MYGAYRLFVPRAQRQGGMDGKGGNIFLPSFPMHTGERQAFAAIKRHLKVSTAYSSRAQEVGRGTSASLARSVSSSCLLAKHAVEKSIRTTSDRPRFFGPGHRLAFRPHAEGRGLRSKETCTRHHINQSLSQCYPTVASYSCRPTGT